MTGKQILIADDEKCIRDSLEHIVSVSGHIPILACNGVEAFTRYNRALHTLLPIDMLITDLLMPRMNGTELVSKVVEINPFLPVIIMSGQEDVESVRAQMYAGTWELIQKPFSKSKLLDAISRSLEKAAKVQVEAHNYTVINSLIRVERNQDRNRG